MGEEYPPSNAAGSGAACYIGLVLSIVIPTLNAASSLPATLASLAEGAWAGLDPELIVADGGSTDATAAIATSHGARVVTGARGRGAQLAAGAASAGRDWLLFLHADTRLAPGWAAMVREFCAHPNNQGRAGWFRLVLDDPSPHARRIERLAAWRCHNFALPYGDQGLLLRRTTYDSVGGFRGLPLMEDVDLVRRLGRARLVGLAHDAVTSAARYRRDGWWRRPARNLLCLSLYFAGVSPSKLVKIYR
jgi:rSAM/selenodomain-associated transferase 2